MATAITIENVSKRYRLGSTHAGSIRDGINRFAGKFLRRKTAGNVDAEENADRVDTDGTFWALRDVSFEVAEGAAIGIIGKNGAGKSTLLKILSRITSPTSGRIEMFGRVASLLEVGTGFHPELTGRENMYLNGTVLGMTKAEVNRQFDAIVDFAGVDKFIDTPVKRYSSGMKVRLGFAVAAHLEPEILIVDEVLAVGDMDFQRKCLGKMDDVAKSGRTIMFVSHNMAAVSQLCRSGVVLDSGTATQMMPISAAIDHYIQQSPAGSRDGVYLSQSPPSGVRIASISVRQSDADTGVVRHDHDFDLVFNLLGLEVGNSVRLSIAVCDRFQRKIFTAVTDLNRDTLGNREITAKVLRVRKRFLMPGRYSLIAGLLDARMQIMDSHRFVCPFVIENVGDDPMLSGEGDYGIVFGEHHWCES